MKYICAILIVLSFCSPCFSQKKNKSLLPNHYFSLIPGSQNPALNRIELQSDTDTTWHKWDLRGYNFGFDPAQTPMHTTVNGILDTPYMIQVRGNENEKNKKRWGYHVFEGYARDDKSRITLLLNKHEEEERPVAELYYYGTVYNHSEPAYNWFRIGSDVRQHSYMFGRDRAIFYGSLQLSNALTLGNIGKGNILAEKPAGDDERNYQDDAKNVNFKALKNADNGTMFYDKDHHIIVIKVDGQWMKLAVEPLPEGVEYAFE